jgi:4-hydroxymandelate oxidase
MTGMHDRRRFLAYLASSPLLAGQDLTSYVIADPKEAINVLDFEAAAKKVLPPAHFGYMATGVEDDVSLRANREGFQRFYLRPRRLVDISRNVDLRTEVFGTAWETPIGLAPIGNTMAFHAEGELPVARAARVKNINQIISTNANTAIEKIAETRGSPVWFQLYCPPNWSIAEKLVKRAEAAGCPALALTVDTQAGRRTETFERYKRFDKRDCVVCHGTTREHFYVRKPMFRDINMKGVSTQDPAMTWQLIGKLRKLTSMKVLVQGIEVGEDAKLCIDSGADGLIVSNHGGRAGDTGRGTIECLPEVIEAVGGKVPVFIDGGFRRGSDVFKALALGAKAVFIGRPYIWGLAAFGQPGVERVLDLLRLELELVMKQCGTRSVAEITRAYVGWHARG